MRYQGRITDWKDDKGYRFVTPHDGGPRIFVHIKAFSHRLRRPVGNETVSYELSVDARGRPQGVKVAFVGQRPAALSSQSAPGPGVVALRLAGAFLAFVAGTVAAGRLPFPVLLGYLGASCVTYVAYGLDKAAASNGQWRIPERTLHLLGLVGGWPGALLAQRRLRHKTRKQSFQVAFWATVVLNCVAFGWLFSPSGMRTVALLLGAP